MSDFGSGTRIGSTERVLGGRITHVPPVVCADEWEEICPRRVGTEMWKRVREGENLVRFGKVQDGDGWTHFVTGR